MPKFKNSNETFLVIFKHCAQSQTGIQKAPFVYVYAMQSAFYCKRDETILYLNFQFKVLGNVVEDGKTDAKWQHVLFPSEMPQRAYDSMEPFKGDCQGDIDRANTKSVQKAINKYHDMPATRKLHHLV